MRSPAVLWVLLFAATLALGQTSSTLNRAIDVYENAIAGAESGATPRGVEAALAAVWNLREELLARVSDDTRSVLEALSAAEFTQLAQLPGVFVRRGDVLVVHPDADFFSELAERNGDEADQRFAAALAATYPDGYWPVYVEGQTEYSGCTVFDEGRLLGTYLAWSAMEHDFPDRYASAVEHQLAAVSEHITTSTCVCEERAVAVVELERIVASPEPSDTIRAAVRERLAALNEGRSNIRFACISG